MPKKPPIHELEFLKQSNNHLEFARRLQSLGIPTAALRLYAEFVCTAWFQLGQSHLAEAKNIAATQSDRAVYSRAYYAAYNASKATRYMVSGFVSLKGDDHGKASTDLPGDFPNVVKWAGILSTLYEHRLRADYDNWTDTAAQLTLTPVQVIEHAEEFIEEARNYLNGTAGTAL